jgi:hypothetical protein
VKKLLLAVATALTLVACGVSPTVATAATPTTQVAGGELFIIRFFLVRRFAVRHRYHAPRRYAARPKASSSRPQVVRRKSDEPSWAN